ncbi:MAG: hypothetical protein KAX66_08985 [Propionivibrio sp.]|nr:hypothetical protein [Propionivibrio sp.]
MPGLTADQKKSLDELIVTYGTSLNRSDDEAELRKSVEEKAERLGIDKKNFKLLAKAVWKNQRQAERDRISDQLDLFDLYGDFEDDQGKKRLAKLKDQGLVSATYTRGEALQ